MAQVFEDGFESNNFSGWDNDTSGTIAISSLQANQGTYSARINHTSSTTGFARKAVYGSNQTGTAYARIYVYIATAPSSTIQLFRWSNTSNAHVGSIRLTSSRTLTLNAASNAQIGSASAALSLNTWYYVELKITAPSNPGTLEGKLNGSVFATGNNSAQGSFARLLIGNVTPNATSDIYFDSVVVDDAAYPGAAAVAPTVTTQAVSSIGVTTATGNGNVTSDNGSTITERGVCWSTSTNPTTANSKATSAGTTGSFTASMTGLTQGTHYYVRAYAINAGGTSYGSVEEFDTDPQTPPTVALDAPADGSVLSDSTPTLEYIGTDGEGEDITYQVQVYAKGTTRKMGWVFPDNTINAATDVAAFKWHTLSAMWYQLSTAGELVFRDTSAYGSNFYYTTTNAGIVRDNCQMALINVSSGNATAVNALTSDAGKRAAAVATLVSFCQTNEFQGVDCDMETFKVASMDATQYTNWKTFINELGTACHAAGLTLTVEVPAIWNTAANTESGTGDEWDSANSQGYYRLVYADFNTLPVDNVAIMAYDYQNDYGAGRANQPLQWLEDTLSFAKSVIDEDLIRIIAGIPAAGYSATTGSFVTTGRTYDYLAAQTGFGGASRDADSGEIIWANGGTSYALVDDTGIDIKMAVAAGLDIDMVALWHVGDNQYGTDDDDVRIIDAISDTDSGFANIDTPADTDPFNSGDLASYTVQGGDALPDGLYLWRIRGIDPAGSDTFGPWTPVWEFEVDTTGSTTISPADLALGLFTDAATITQNHAITTQDISVGLSTDNASITQNHTVAPQDISVALSEDNATTAQNHVIATQDATLSLTEDAATITQVHILQAADTTIGLSEDATTVSEESSTISPANVTFGLSIDNATITQNHTIVVQDIALGLTIDGTTVSQNHLLAPNDVSLALSEENTAIVQTNFVLVAQDIALGLNEDAATINQNHVMSVHDMAIGVTLDTATIALVAIIIVPADLALNLSEDTTTLNQTHSIVAADVLLGLTSTSALISMPSGDPPTSVVWIPGNDPSNGLPAPGSPINSATFTPAGLGSTTIESGNSTSDVVWVPGDQI